MVIFEDSVQYGLMGCAQPFVHVLCTQILRCNIHASKSCAGNDNHHACCIYIISLKGPEQEWFHGRGPGKSQPSISCNLLTSKHHPRVSVDRKERGYSIQIPGPS